MSEELEQFKRNIDLVQYAEKCGYAVDRRKSSKKNVIMRRGSEKIGIGVNKRTGHQNYNNFSTGRGGTIIDFCQKETSKNLGQVRQELRSFSGMQKPERIFYFKSPDVLKKERKMQTERLAKEKMRAERLVKSEYLQQRGISEQTLNSALFKNRVFTDANNNVCFPHTNTDNKFSGFEKKNTNFTGFSGGGEKGLWYSNAPKRLEKIVVCESAIDCLSHAQLTKAQNTAYVSVGGQMSQEQENELKSMIERHQNVEIVAGFDNDRQGEKYTEDLKKLANRDVTRDLPDNKDFNEDLQQQQQQNQQQDSKQDFRDIAEQNSASAPAPEQENENDYELEL